MLRSCAREDAAMAARKPPADPKTRLADAALKRLAKTPWPDLTLVSLAKAARVPLAELQMLCGSKPALFGLILTRCGTLAAETYVPEPGTAHDRLFEVAMSWFEVLAPHKKAVRALYEGLKRDPLTLLAARAEIAAAGSWLLTLAEADTGPALPLRALALSAALGRTVPVWLDDDKDLTRTMARLDLDIRRGETILERIYRGADAGADEPA